MMIGVRQDRSLNPYPPSFFQRGETPCFIPTPLPLPNSKPEPLLKPCAPISLRPLKLSHAGNGNGWPMNG